MPDNPAYLFLHDVPDSQKWDDAVRPHALATKKAPATGAAYLTVPSIYVLCALDRAILLPMQKEMVASAR